MLEWGRWRPDEYWKNDTRPREENIRFLWGFSFSNWRFPSKPHPNRDINFLFCLWLSSRFSSLFITSYSESYQKARSSSESINGGKLLGHVESSVALSEMLNKKLFNSNNKSLAAIHGKCHQQWTVVKASNNCVPLQQGWLFVVSMMSLECLNLSEETMRAVCLGFFYPVASSQKAL